jgi:hypothetical protein
MRSDLRTIYNEFLHAASAAVVRGDKQAAMFCLTHAMRCANTVHDNPNYRSKVMRAMNFARRIGG